jgi:hypothetical protein
MEVLNSLAGPVSANPEPQCRQIRDVGVAAATEGGCGDPDHGGLRRSLLGATPAIEPLR